MEQKNLLIAIVLAVAIMIGWQWYYSTLVPPEDQTAEQQTTPATTETSPAPVAPSAPGATPVPVPGAAQPTQQATAQQSIENAVAAAPRVKIVSERVSGSISLIGAKLDDLTLLDYRRTVNPNSPNIRLLRPVGGPNPYFADFGWVGSGVKVPTSTTRWSADSDALSPGKPVTLTWDNGEGLIFSLAFNHDANYMFTVTQSVRNTGNTPVTLFPFGRVERTSTPEITDFYILHEGLLGVFDGVLQEVDYDDIQEEKVIRAETTGGWIGITDKYWLAALIPNQETKATARFYSQPVNGVDKYQVDFAGAETVIPAGGTASVANRLFAGAKEAKLVTRYRDELNITRFDLAIDWGWFEFLTKPIFFALIYIHDYVGNMGVAILLLTVLIKLAFFPLANKSYRAMSKMKELQPEMMKLRERFGDDRARMNQEVMALYKREKANPAAGCLPILPQIPVFFALYKVLFVTIEMRQAPFFGWIQDLSAMDTLTFVNLFGLIDWTPPEIMIIGVWPVIMGVTMYLQQKLNPPPPDPTQAKIFMLLPVVFTVMLARFPAGLVIYWAWNNFLSILQQYVIMRRAGVPIGGGKVEKPAAANANAPAKTKGKPPKS